MKKILIYPEYPLPHIWWLILGIESINPKNYEFHISNIQKRPSEYANFKFTNLKTLSYDEALRNLSNGIYDAVLLSDGSQILFLLEHLKNTKKIFLDSSDHSHIISQYINSSDIVLKCQHPNSKFAFVGDSISIEPYYGSKLIFPWPYCPSKCVEPNIVLNEKRIERVFFYGWAWPKKRVDTAMKIIESGIDIHGGFYNRPEYNVSYYSETPKSLQVPRMPFNSYMSALQMSLIGLNLVGNGEMCFRAHEILMSGTCMVSQKLNVDWGTKPPQNGIEWIEVDDKDLPGVINMLLKNKSLANQIGENGKKYWDNYLSKEAIANRFMGILN